MSRHSRALMRDAFERHAVQQAYERTAYARVMDEGHIDPDIERNLAVSQIVQNEFEERSRGRGGTLEFEMDRYGHIKLRMEIR